MKNKISTIYPFSTDNDFGGVDVQQYSKNSLANFGEFEESEIEGFFDDTMTKIQSNDYLKYGLIAVGIFIILQYAKKNHILGM